MIRRAVSCSLRVLHCFVAGYASNAIRAGHSSKMRIFLFPRPGPVALKLLEGRLVLELIALQRKCTLDAHA